MTQPDFVEETKEAIPRLKSVSDRAAKWCVILVMTTDGTRRPRTWFHLRGYAFGLIGRALDPASVTRVALKLDARRSQVDARWAT
jgi:hypothetical protein